jgi:hypothetical protein
MRFNERISKQDVGFQPSTPLRDLVGQAHRLPAREWQAERLPYKVKDDFVDAKPSEDRRNQAVQTRRMSPISQEIYKMRFSRRLNDEDR